MNKNKIITIGLIVPLVLCFQNCAGEGQSFENSGTQMEPQNLEPIRDADPNAFDAKVMTGTAQFTSAQVSDAISRPLTNFVYKLPGGAGTNAPYFGPAAVVVAHAAYNGNVSAQKRLLQQLRYNIVGGHEPSGAGGYPAQHELIFTVAAAFAKKTPEVWNALSSSEKSKIDLLIRGIAVGAAYTSSNRNPTKNRNLVGDQSWPTAAPNFATAPMGNLVAAGSYMGDSALTTFLNSFNQSSFASQVKSAGFSQMYEVFRLNGPSGKVGVRPTTSQISSTIKNWKWTLTDSSDLNTNIDKMISYTFSKVIEAGYDNGRGIAGRAKLMSGASGLPNKGKVGMNFELDTNDAEGVRSSMSYSMWGTRVSLNTLVLAMAEGYRMPSAIKSRLNYGMIDMKYKTDHGYFSYAHAGHGNSEDWDTGRTQQWGLTYSFGMYFNVIAKY